MIRTDLGTVPTSTLISGALTSAAGISAATGATAAALTALGIGLQAVPVVGTIIGGIALAIAALGVGNGCGATCTEATTIANNASAALAANLAAGQQQAAANGGCITSAEQAVLLANIQTIYQQLVAGCQQIPAPGGTQCVADRQPGGKYDIQAENIPSIMAIPVCSPAASLTSSLGLGSNTSLLMLAGLGLLAFALLEK